MNSVQKLLPFVSIASLVAIFALAAAVMGGAVERSTSNIGMLIATLVWFGTAPFWVGRSKE